MLGGRGRVMVGSVRSRIVRWCLKNEMVVKMLGGGWARGGIRSPIWGNGRLFVEEAQTFYGLPAAVNAHNMWLEVLVEGGILTLSAFLIIMILVMIRNDKKQSLFYRILLIPIAVCLVVMSVDSMIETRGVMFFAFLAIGYHCPYYASAVDPLVLSRFEDGSFRLSPALWIAKIRRARIRSKLLR